MPRTTFIRKHVKIDHTVAILKQSAAQNNIKWVDVAAKMEMQPGSLSNKMKRGSGNFTLDFIRKLAKAVDCPMDDLTYAVTEDLSQ